MKIWEKMERDIIEAAKEIERDDPEFSNCDRDAFKRVLWSDDVYIKAHNISRQHYDEALNEAFRKLRG